MAYKARKIPDDIVFALALAHNDLQESTVDAEFHADITSSTVSTDYMVPVRSNLLITAATATDTPTAVALANDAKVIINIHFADTLAHDTAVSAQVATADATDEATAITLANALKAAYNTHLSEASVHFNNDGTNNIAAADASDASTLNTLLNEMKTDQNAHSISAPAGSMIDIIRA